MVLGEALGENKSSLRNTESRPEAYGQQGTHGCNSARDLKRSGLFGRRVICSFQRTARTAPGNAGGSLSTMLQPLQALQESVGHGSAQGNLLQALDGIFKFHQRVIPATAGLFAEPELLALYRNSLKGQGKGPHLSMRVLAEYIRSEQRLGRIESRADASRAASLMMPSSFFRAFVEHVFGTPMQPAWREFSKEFDSIGCTSTRRRVDVSPREDSYDRAVHSLENASGHNIRAH